jgi:hypothetical protein
MSQPDYNAAHKHSIFNREEIMGGNLCGCFYCLKTFEPSQIVEWAEEDGAGQTVICPNCGIDSVIGSNSGFKIDENLLKEMHQRWF